MRGDQKWPPQSVKEAVEAENEARRMLARGPACRPRKVTKLLTGTHTNITVIYKTQLTHTCLCVSRYTNSAIDTTFIEEMRNAVYMVTQLNLRELHLFFSRVNLYEI